jgi:hypothetical protein
MLAPDWMVVSQMGTLAIATKGSVLIEVRLRAPGHE